MKKTLPWILIAVAVLVATRAAHWPELKFAKLDGGEFIARLGALVVFAMLIERTVEVFLTIWRAEDAYKCEAAVQRLVNAGKTGTDPDLKAAQEELIRYRTETQRWALP